MMGSTGWAVFWRVRQVNRPLRLSRLGWAVAVSASVALRLHPAHAEDVARRWYGDQSLVVDGTAVGVTLIGGGVVLGTAGDITGLVVGAGTIGLGGLTYLIGSPIVHLAHGRGGIAGASLGLRTVPAIPVSLLFALRPLKVGPGVALVTAIPVTALGAMAVDDFVLAYETTSRVSIVPMVDRETRGLVVAGSW